MAIAWDASVESVRTGTTDPHTWTHTPVGTPRGIIVAIIHGTSSTDHVSTVTYGGVSMAEVIRRTDTSTEPGAAELWFLGTGIPTGNQTVSVDLASATTDDIEFVSMSFTAEMDTQIVDSDGIAENATNPSVTLQYTGRTCLAVAALYGGGAAPSSFTPNGNCTAVQSEDLGAFYASVIRQTTPGTSDFAIGGTASGDDVAYVAAAISETLGVYATPGSYAITGTDTTLRWVGQMHLKASANIAASAATATTARLTAPSGKTTSDFVAGRISDDTNPMPTIDITTDDYSEFEWCIESAAGLTATNVYEFRVIAGSTPLDTYTVTPQWTIGANAYSMGADSGSYVVTGTATGIARQITIVADSGSYALTGTDVTLSLARNVVADPGSYVVTGTDTGIVSARLLTADSGSYVVTGTNNLMWLGPATQVGFIVHPDGAVAGVAFTTQPQAAVLNRLSTAAYESGITLTVAIDTGIGTLGGTATAVTDSQGIAVWTNLSLNMAQDAVLLSVNGPGLTGNLSAPFEVTGNASLVPDSGSYVLTGTDASLIYTNANDYTITADSGSYAVTGTDAGLFSGRKAIADPGSYAVTGTDTGLLLAARITADSGSYAITGTDATLTVHASIYLVASSHIAASAATATTARLTAPAGKTTSNFVAGRISDDTNPLPTIDIGSGQYTELEWCLSTVAGLTTSNVYEFRVLAGSSVLDTYTVTPTWTIGSVAYTITADPGSYTLTGTNVGTLSGRACVADPGSYAVTGTDAALRYSKGVSADPGSYVITGTAAALLPQSVPGSYAITGTNAALIYNRFITADAGSYAVVGTDAALTRQGKITADPGVYNTTGVDAALVFEGVGDFQIVAESGAYAITGTDAALRSPRSVVIDPGIYLVTGTATGLLATRMATAVSGAYALTGTDAALRFGVPGNYEIDAVPGAYLVSGRPVDMRYGGVLPPSRPGKNRHPRPKPFVAGSK